MRNLIGTALLAAIYGGFAWAISWTFDVTAERALLITILAAVSAVRWHQGSEH